MTLRLGINGFGRIGRLILRALIESGRKDATVVAVNDLGSPQDLAHLLRFDSSHGRLPFPVAADEDGLDIDGRRLRVVAERNPEALPWGELDVDIVLECTGMFADRAKAEAHLRAGARRVLISAPATGADCTVVYGVNHRDLSADCEIVSNASCTTNCLAPLIAVLDAAFGVERGFMTTVHAYTGDQRLIDALHKDPRRARAAAQAIVPTSTGAARAIGLVLPHLEGKLEGSSVRVPVANVSMVDLTVLLKRKAEIHSVNAAFEKAAEGGDLKGILGIAEPHTVSCDFLHDPRSSIVDPGETRIIDGTLLHTLSWYDNEWGFVNRMLDVAVLMGTLLKCKPVGG